MMIAVIVSNERAIGPLTREEKNLNNGQYINSSFPRLPNVPDKIQTDDSVF